ncbi:hypothetical protein POVWA2_049340 [Plasmodium ovale wallikeri]|uniref:Uncharacterized protein n=1 Tax=Plasmodium ovale wallikeri TaxID=864142 RepID=A0A1A8ZMN8_PLAOA|nr:hypothetical protein POVWA1_040810 [Plasmodium ovale wallikeri]SBT45153.1 hypothetical protein POVWA2_049340 [Plasmodium ovale wallikeri]
MWRQNNSLPRQSLVASLFNSLPIRQIAETTVIRWKKKKKIWKKIGKKRVGKGETGKRKGTLRCCKNLPIPFNTSLAHLTILTHTLWDYMEKRALHISKREIKPSEGGKGNTQGEEQHCSFITIKNYKYELKKFALSSYNCTCNGAKHFARV